MKKLIHKSCFTIGNNRSVATLGGRYASHIIGDSINHRLKSRVAITRKLLPAIKNSDTVNLVLSFPQPVILGSNIVEVKQNDSTQDKNIKKENIKKAFGLWKDKNIDGLEFQQKLRDEWE